MGKHSRLYKLATWQRLRRHQLATQPLCAYCLEQEEVTAATVVDHVKPHHGNMTLFRDQNNLQSLCKPCHDGRKQREERGQDVITFGLDGWPMA